MFVRTTQESSSSPIRLLNNRTYPSLIVTSKIWMILMPFKLKTQDSPSRNCIWKLLAYRFIPMRTHKRSLLCQTSKPYSSKTIFLTTSPSHPSQELSRSHQSRIWPSSGLIYEMYRVVKMLNYLSTGVSTWAITLLWLEEQIWIPEFPSARTAGNGVTSLSRVESRGQMR